MRMMAFFDALYCKQLDTLELACLRVVVQLVSWPCFAAFLSISFQNSFFCLVKVYSNSVCDAYIGTEFN